MIDRSYFHFITEDSEATVWKIRARQGAKVEAIKALRSQIGTGSQLKAAKDCVEEYLRRLEAGPTAGDVVVKTTHVRLPNGATLNIVDNGMYAAITLSKPLRVNIPAAELHQAIADAVLDFGTLDLGEGVNR